MTLRPGSKPSSLADSCPSVEVVVPSYLRPEHLARCLAALAQQSHAPARVLVVIRIGDHASSSVVAEHRNRGAEEVLVGEPGVVAAMKAGFVVSRAPFLGLIDDDAVAPPDWIERMLAHLTAGAADVVCGKDLVAVDSSFPAPVVGRWSFYGRSVGNHHRGVGPARVVDYYKGVNVMFKRDAVLLPPPGLLRGTGAEVHWELLSSRYLAEEGRTVVYDPACVVYHNIGIRHDADKRDLAAFRPVVNAAYNETVAYARQPALRRWLSYFFLLFVGNAAAPGLLRGAVAAVRVERIVMARLRPTLRGRVQAWAVLPVVRVRELAPLRLPLHSDIPKPRVAWLALTWPVGDIHPGGVGQYLVRLAEALADHLDLHVITLHGGRQVPGVTVHELSELVGRGQLRRYYVAPWFALSKALALAPDLIHSHGDDGALLLRRHHPPVVRTYYGSSASEARNSRLRRRVNHAMLAQLERATMSLVTTRIGIGPDSAERFRCKRLVPPVVRPKGQSERSEKSPSPSLIFVGTFRGRKRGALFQEVARAVRLFSPALECLVIGPSSDVAAYEDWIRFEHSLTDEQVAREMQRAWVAVVPSTYEGFGIPAWEAMFQGTPVVATANPGVCYASGDEGACLIVSDEELPGAVLGVLGSAELRESMISAGCRRAEAILRVGGEVPYLETYGAVGGWRQ